MGRAFPLLSPLLSLFFSLPFFLSLSYKPNSSILPAYQFIISAITLPLCARYLERIWGARELLKFCFVVIVASNIIGVGLSWILFFVLGKADLFLCVWSGD